jgi:hypothetical protein
LQRREGAIGFDMGMGRQNFPSDLGLKHEMASSTPIEALGLDDRQGRKQENTGNAIKLSSRVWLPMFLAIGLYPLHFRSLAIIEDEIGLQRWPNIQFVEAAL